jgi:hypothetical protein
MIKPSPQRGVVMFGLSWVAGVIVLGLLWAVGLLIRRLLGIGSGSASRVRRAESGQLTGTDGATPDRNGSATHL